MQAWCQDDRGWRLACKESVDLVDGQFAQPSLVEVEGGQWRVDQIDDAQPVVADQCAVVRYSDAEPASGPERADRNQVVEGRYGRWRGPSQSTTRVGLPCCSTEELLSDQGRNHVGGHVHLVIVHGHSRGPFHRSISKCREQTGATGTGQIPFAWERPPRRPCRTESANATSVPSSWKRPYFSLLMAVSRMPDPSWSERAAIRQLELMSRTLPTGHASTHTRG